MRIAVLQTSLFPPHLDQCHVSCESPGPPPSQAHQGPGHCCPDWLYSKHKVICLPILQALILLGTCPPLEPSPHLLTLEFSEKPSLTHPTTHKRRRTCPCPCVIQPCQTVWACLPEGGLFTIWLPFTMSPPGSQGPCLAGLSTGYEVPRPGLKLVGPRTLGGCMNKPL